MRIISKVELKKQLDEMGINVVQGNYIKKSEAEKIVGDVYDDYCKRLNQYISKLKKQKSPKEIRQLRLLAELYDYVLHIKPRGDKMYKFIEQVDEILDDPENQDAGGFYDLLDEGIEFLKEG